jgi:hypothetical protein
MNHNPNAGLIARVSDHISVRASDHVGRYVGVSGRDHDGGDGHEGDDHGGDHDGGRPRWG